MRRHTVIRVITAHLHKDAAVSWCGADLDCTGVVFDGGDFAGAEFSGGTVSFRAAKFSGGMVSFGRAAFSGGTVEFYRPASWASPPTFPWTDTLPSGVKLPEKDDRSRG
jgi:Pentapeptide repeats (9 copies)